MGKFISLLDESVVVPLPTAVSFTSEELYEPALTQKIGCWYIRPGRPYGLVILGTTGEFELFVKAPANSQAEATLEISLQRARLIKNEAKATAKIPFNIKWKPGDTVFREGRNWKVVRVDHQTAGGATPDVTTLSLRQIPVVVLQ